MKSLKTPSPILFQKLFNHRDCNKRRNTKAELLQEGIFSSSIYCQRHFSNEKVEKTKPTFIISVLKVKN